MAAPPPPDMFYISGTDLRFLFNMVGVDEDTINKAMHFAQKSSVPLPPTTVTVRARTPPPPVAPTRWAMVRGEKGVRVSVFWLSPELPTNWKPSYNKEHHILLYQSPKPPFDIDSSCSVHHLVMIGSTTRELMNMHKAIPDWKVRMLEMFVVDPGNDANFFGPKYPFTGYHYKIRPLPETEEALEFLEGAVRKDSPMRRQHTSLNHVDEGKGYHPGWNKLNVTEEDENDPDASPPASAEDSTNKGVGTSTRRLPPTDAPPAKRKSFVPPELNVSSILGHSQSNGPGRAAATPVHTRSAGQRTPLPPPPPPPPPPRSMNPMTPGGPLATSTPAINYAGFENWARLKAEKAAKQLELEKRNRSLCALEKETEDLRALGNENEENEEDLQMIGPNLAHSPSSHHPSPSADIDQRSGNSY